MAAATRSSWPIQAGTRRPTRSAMRRATSMWSAMRRARSGALRGMLCAYAFIRWLRELLEGAARTPGTARCSSGGRGLVSSRHLLGGYPVCRQLEQALGSRLLEVLGDALSGG